MSQYTIIHKLVRVSVKIKIFPQETMAAVENRFAPALNEKEVIELLEILGAFLMKQLFHSRLLDMR